MQVNLQGYLIDLPDPPEDKKLIYGWDKPISEQVWERPYTLSDEQYDALTFAQQSEIRKVETERRVLGFWFMLNGKPFYLTGNAYFFYTHFTIDGSYPTFVREQAEDFWFYEHAKNDKFCDGIDELKPRQEGATSRKQSIFINEGTMSFDCHFGIQSKTADDAEKVNFDKMVIAFSRIPDWMKPELQNTAFPPHEALIFGRSRIVTGKSKAGKFLNTIIDWKPTVSNAYDGKKLKYWIGDEGGKWIQAKFDDTWKIVRPALRKANGFAFVLSTMGEVDEKAADAYRRLWKDSDPNNRTANGYTISGLYKYFIPNYRAYFHIEVDGKPVLDKYGELNIPAIKRYLKNEFDALKTEKEKFFFIRQNPSNAEEALNYGAASNVFDTFRLAERLKYLDNFYPSDSKPVKYLVGNLYWIDNIRFGRVGFRSDPNGKFKIGFLPSIAGDAWTNRIFREDNIMRPYSDSPYRMGIDPYQRDNKEGEEYSKGAFHIKLMSNVMYPHLSNIYCLEYCFREKLAEMFYEDIALAMFFYGARVNFERSAYSEGLENYMRKNHLLGFLMNRPDVTRKSAYTKRDNEKGTPASEQNIAMGIRYIENYIAEPNPMMNENTVDNLKNFWFEDTLKQLMNYTIEGKTKFDLVASMQNTEIACQPDKKVRTAAKDQAETRKRIFEMIYPYKGRLNNQTEPTRKLA